MDASQENQMRDADALNRFECRVVSASSALSILSDWPDEARVLLVRGRESDRGQQDANAALARLLIRLARTDTSPAEAVGEVLAHEVGLEVRPVQHTVTFRGAPITLTASEFSLLVELMVHRDRVRTPEQLAEAIWGYEQVGNPNFVQAHVSRMRKKLTASGCPDVITTVRSRGYVIRNAEVTSAGERPGSVRPEPDGPLGPVAVEPVWQGLSAA